MATLADKIIYVMRQHPEETEPMRDLFSHAKNIEKEDFEEAHRLARIARQAAGKLTLSKTSEEGFELYRQTLLFDAPYFLDEYLQYLEIDREPSARFYMPRRKILLPEIQMIQDLVDGKLDEGFLSKPPRTGKTTECAMVMSWLLGRNGESSNLYSAYSDIITKKFYDAVLEILQDTVTYRWNDVFPEAKVVSTNAAEETLNIDRKKHYPSLTCRSLYGTLNGACDCSGLLVADDLIGGIEEALNKDRMASCWSKVENNLLTRAKSSARVLWIGTRWSLIDPIGLRLDLLENDENFADVKYKVINTPALDPVTDESNFDYQFGVGFDTAYYKQRRASFERDGDMASWNAQYQGVPIEREGTVFAPDEMRYYDGNLPDVETPDWIFMPVDPAYGGGDYVAAPVCVRYGDDIFVHDVVYSPDEKDKTTVLLGGKIEKYGITACRVEANKMTEAYAEQLGEVLRGLSIHINLTTKPAPTTKSKEQRIFDKAPDIREHFIFRASGKRSKEYQQFMDNVFSFKITGKNKHDDAPDSLAMAAEMAFFTKTNTVRTFKRPF